MTEIYNKRYVPVGEASFGHRVFREGFIPAADLAVDAPYVTNALTVNMHGFSRQAFKVIPIHAAGTGSTVDVEIQEFLQQADDPDTGTWATKGGLGVGSAAKNVMFEHNSEDTMRWVRIKLTPKTTVPDGGIRFEISGRRDA